MAEEEEVIEEIVKVEEGDETTLYRSKGLTICVIIKSNPSQWQTTAKWGIHE